MERPIHCPSPVITGRMTTIVESKKRSPFTKFLGGKIDENEENALETDETESDVKGKKMIRYSNNFNLLTTVKESASKSSINTPISKPDPRAQMFARKAVGIQNNLLNLIRMDPEKPGPTITSEFQERKEKEVKKNVSNVRNNLKNLF